MKKKIIMMLVIIAAVFTTQVNAKQFYASEKVIIKEQQEHSVFAAGDEIKTSSFIDGSAFIAGMDVEISSNQDVLFVAGEEIKIKNAYTKDAFLAGSEIEIENSEIRDLFAFGEDIEITSPISNNAYLAGTKVVIDSVVAGNVNIAAERIVITENARINGTLKYPENVNIRIADEAVIEKTKTYNITKNQQTVPTIKMQISSILISYLSVLVIGFIMLALFKKHFAKTLEDDLTVKNVAIKTALGLSVLILIPFVSAIAMVSIVGLPLAFILLALYIIGIYLSIIPTGYYFANKLLKDKVKNEYAILAIGIAAIKLLELVPVVGGIAVFISLCFGMCLLFDNRKRPTKHK